MRLLIASIVLLSALAPQAHAEWITNAALLQQCQSARTSVQWGHCVGYITGIADQMSAFGLVRSNFGDGTSPRPRESLCPDQNKAVNFDATVMVPLFVEWAQHHPEALSAPAWTGAGEALQSKWPCKFSP